MIPFPEADPPPGVDLSFHHIGIATRKLDQEEKHYRAFGYVREGDDFEDPIQGIGGRFLIGGGPRLELLVEMPGRDVLTPWLRRGVRMYHLAWEVGDIAAAIRSFVDARAKVVVEPVPAVAFDGRHIAFLMMPNLQLIEFIERKSNA